MLEQLGGFYEAHGELFAWVALSSVVLFVLSILSLPWLVSRIPEDYFLSSESYSHTHEFRHPVIRIMILTLKNLVGFILLLAGMVMLVLPGQGLLTILMGLVLLNFPGKRQFERWFIKKHAVLKALNWLRRRAGHAPLLEPE
jgi:archaellum biogenesis protein FlaJ (TadC family)